MSDHRGKGQLLNRCRQLHLRQRHENCTVVKKFLRCTYFLAKNRITHTTNFAELVKLVVACGASDLQRFLHSEVRKNAKYTSTTAVSDFIAAIAQWVENRLLRSLKQSSYFTLMGDECTDITPMEELSLCFRWLKGGKPEEHFLQVIHFTRTDAESLQLYCLHGRKGN